MGYELLVRGEPRAALPYLERAAQTLPLLADHALFFLGGAALKIGEFEKAQDVFTALVTQYPRSVYHRESIQRLAEAGYRTGRLVEAGRRVNEVERVSRGRDLLHWVHLMRGRIALAGGDRKGAQVAFSKIWIDDPGGILDDDVQRVLRDYGIVFSPQELGRRAKGLLKISQPSLALEIYKGLIPEGGVGPLEWEEGRILALIRLGELEAAANRIDELHRRKMLALWRERLTRLQIRVALRGNRFDEALGLLAEGNHGLTPFAVRRKTASVLMDAGRYREATVKYSGLVSQGSRRERANLLWAAGWGFFRSGGFDEAAGFFLKGEELAKDSGEMARFMYWRGRSLEILGRSDEATRLHCALIDSTGWSYYGLLAAQRLGNEACPDVVAAIVPRHAGKEGRREMPAPVLTGLHGSRLAELFHLRLKPLAAREVREVAQEIRNDRETIIRLAALSQEVDNYSFSSDVAASYYKIGLSGRRPETTDAAVWRLGFPAAYPSLVAGCRARDGLEPEFVRSIIHQESHFRTDALSRSWAIGLMQLIPPTARSLARDLSMTGFELEDLLDPAKNIRLGCHYLSRLAVLFHGEKIYMAAAYNAGEDAVQRWLVRRHNMSEEVFIEEIPFAETNDYVKKVMANYWTYQTLDRGHVPQGREK